jgi:hypothetical protein
MITTASLAAMTAFAQSGLTASVWARANRARLQRDVVAPMQAVMAAVERVWGEDFHSDLSRVYTPSGVRLHRDRMYLGACTRTPAWLHAATAAWVPRDFVHDPKIAPRIELRLAYGFWEMGFAFTSAGRPWMSQMAANLLPNQQVLERMLEPLLGGHYVDWCVRERQRIVAPQGHGIVNTYEPCEARHFFDGVTAWDRVISATTATAWDTLPEVGQEKLAALIVRVVQRVYPLIILTTAADPDTAVRGIENYLILLAKEHPAMLPKRPSNILQFPAARS